MGQKLVLGCNKVKPYLLNQNIYEFYDSKYITSNLKQHKDYDYTLNGKIVAECDFEVEEIYNFFDEIDGDFGYWTKNLSEEDLLKRSCITKNDILDYINNLIGYAIHIKNLHIFDKPRELEGYTTWDWVEYSSGPVYAIPIKPLTRLTRMTRVMSLKYDDGDYAISLSPKEMCRVLNGEQDILVRKTVLKELRPND